MWHCPWTVLFYGQKSNVNYTNIEFPKNTIQIDLCSDYFTTDQCLTFVYGNLMYILYCSMHFKG